MKRGDFATFYHKLRGTVQRVRLVKRPPRSPSYDRFAHWIADRVETKRGLFLVAEDELSEISESLSTQDDIHA